MQGIRTALRKLPPSTVIKILRKVFAMSAPAARLILNDVTTPRSSHKPWIRKVKHPKWSGCWIGEKVSLLDNRQLDERIKQADVVLFNVHGGGFRIGKCTMYMDTYIEWIQQLKKAYNLKTMIMSVNYRLAPEYQYPSPVEDVVHAYEQLILGMGVDPNKVITIGDSAGAALILETLFITHDPSSFEIVTDDMDEDNYTNGGPMINELARPAGAILVSPLVTDETHSQSWQENIKYDYISQHTAKVIKRDYFEPAQEDPFTTESNQVLGIAKLHTGFQAFLPPHVLMYVGNLEVLRDDALVFAEKAGNDGVQWKTVAEDCVHDWFCVREVVKDKSILERADKVFVDFVHRAIGEHCMTPRQTGLTTVDEECGQGDQVDEGDTMDDLRLTATALTARHSKSSKPSSSILYV
ncbi:Alpha/Beta hydrolase protein [Chlamydoabsidia padenii]|nr:Alpha/Beta hydrolase protein [Chlamydoabsidia padenii]